MSNPRRSALSSLSCTSMRSITPLEPNLPSEDALRDNATILNQKFFSFLCRPVVLPLVLRSFGEIPKSGAESDPHFHRWLVSLAHQSGSSELMLAILLEDKLATISDPNLLFRDNDLTTRLIKQYITFVVGAQIDMQIKPLIQSLNTSRLSTLQICSKTKRFLKNLTRTELPWAFHRFMGLLRNSIAKRFPKSERIGLVGIFFLRYLCPLIIAAPETFPAKAPTPYYSENAVKVGKLIQSLANGTVATSENEVEKRFHLENVQRICEFVDKLGLVESTCSKLTQPTPVTLNEHQRFFKVMSTCSFRIRQNLKSINHPHLTRSELLEEWTNLSIDLTTLSSMLQKFLEYNDKPPVVKSKTIPPMLSSGSSMEASYLSRSPIQSHLRNASSHQSESDSDSFSRVHGVLATDSFGSLSTSSGQASFPIQGFHQMIEEISFRTVGNLHKPAELELVCPSRTTIAEWTNETVLRWLDTNDLFELHPYMSKVTGKDLIDGQFELPADVKMVLRKQFYTSLNQLKRISQDVFDPACFESPAQQILSLKEALVKMCTLVAHLDPENCSKR